MYTTTTMGYLPSVTDLSIYLHPFMRAHTLTHIDVEVVIGMHTDFGTGYRKGYRYVYVHAHIHTHTYIYMYIHT